MNTTILIIIGVIVTILAIGTFSCFSIHKAYIEYDRRKTKEEELEILKKSIKSAKEYFRKTYDNDLDSAVWTNVKENANFISQLIENKTIDEQLEYYDKLFKMMYETGIRLKKDFNNVQYIMQPLKTLRDELVEEHIEFLKNNMD